MCPPAPDVLTSLCVLFSKFLIVNHHHHHRPSTNTNHRHPHRPSRAIIHRHRHRPSTTINHLHRHRPSTCIGIVCHHPQRPSHAAPPSGSHSAARGIDFATIALHVPLNCLFCRRHRCRYRRRHVCDQTHRWRRCQPRCCQCRRRPHGWGRRVRLSFILPNGVALFVYMCVCLVFDLASPISSSRMVPYKRNRAVRLLGTAACTHMHTKLYRDKKTSPSSTRFSVAVLQLALRSLTWNTSRR